MNAPAPPAWRSYEELTEELAARLATANDIMTVRLERDVLLSGRATDNRIDVLWEYQSAAGPLVRALFECRSYARRINQQALHSWRSIVDDVTEPGIETIGAMVTTTGYQSGAQRVADSYGIVILELRTPIERDLATAQLGAARASHADAAGEGLDRQRYRARASSSLTGALGSLSSTSRTGRASD